MFGLFPFVGCNGRLCGCPAVVFYGIIGRSLYLRIPALLQSAALLPDLLFPAERIPEIWLPGRGGNRGRRTVFLPPSDPLSGRRNGLPGVLDHCFRAMGWGSRLFSNPGGPDDSPCPAGRPQPCLRRRTWNFSGFPAGRTGGRPRGRYLREPRRRRFP